jgi:DNA primase
MRFLFLPQGEDPDTFVRRHGKEAFEKLVREAEPLSGFLLGELEKQSNLRSAEGRSQFLAVAKPHVQKIAAPALKLQIVKEVARLAAVTPEEAETLLGLAPKMAYRHPAPPKRIFKPPSSPEWKLLAYVVARPGLAAELDLALVDMTLPESEALKAVCDWQAAHAGDATPAMLLERFSGTPFEQLLVDAQALAMELDEPEEQALQNARYALCKIEIKHKNNQIKSLGEKLRAGMLSKEEHQAYGRMIAEVKSLEQRLQAEARVGAR